MLILSEGNNQTSLVLKYKTWNRVHIQFSNSYGKGEPNITKQSSIFSDAYSLNRSNFPWDLKYFFPRFTHFFIRMKIFFVSCAGLSRKLSEKFTVRNETLRHFPEEIVCFPHLSKIAPGQPTSKNSTCRNSISFIFTTI